MKYISTLILFFLLIPSIVCAFGTSQQDNYCDDQASWQQWEELLTNSTDTGTTTLYALRIGLCSMVKSGQIETQRAVKLFEEMRDAVINSKHASEDADKQTNRPSI